MIGSFRNKRNGVFLAILGSHWIVGHPAMASSLSDFPRKHEKEHAGKPVDTDLGESAKNRQSKTYSVYVMPIGIVGGNPALGAGAQIRLRTDLSAFMEYTTGHTNMGIVRATDVNNFGDYNVTSAAGGVQGWWGNSFYMNLGGIYKYVAFTKHVPSVEVNPKAESTSLGLTFHLGNQWQWSHFMLGCSWIGFTLPLYVTTDRLVETSGDSASDEDARLYARKKTSEPGLDFLRLNVGMSF